MTPGFLNQCQWQFPLPGSLVAMWIGFPAQKGGATMVSSVCVITNYLVITNNCHCQKEEMEVPHSQEFCAEAETGLE